jgi:hypothetical protein
MNANQWMELVLGTGAQLGTATVTDTFVVINGLTPSTNYRFYVTTDCGGAYVDWNSILFTTDCSPIPALQLCEYFESDDALNCWKVIDANNDADKWQVYSIYANSGTKSLGIYTDFNNRNNDDYVITPAITLTGNEVLTYK